MDLNPIPLSGVVYDPIGNIVSSMGFKFGMGIVHCQTFPSIPHSVGVPYATELVMACPIMPFDEVLVDIVDRDVNVDEDSSGDEEKLSQNAMPSLEDSTTIPLKDIATISRTLERQIPSCERDSLLLLDKDLAEDEGQLELVSGEGVDLEEEAEMVDVDGRDGWFWANSTQYPCSIHCSTRARNRGSNQQRWHTPVSLQEQWSTQVALHQWHQLQLQPHTL